METATKSEKTWTMPTVYRGQIVLWYESGVRDASRACPALVKIESHSSLHLKIFGVDRDYDMDCVRHIDDPSAREGERLTQGAWGYTDAEFN